MFTRISTLLVVTLLLALISTAVLADEPGFPWQDHAPPFDFEFGNLIDNHQQSKLVRDRLLQGFIYIQFTGEFVDGVPVAERANCEDPDLDCRVGWKVKGVPFEAQLVSKAPRVWKVNPDLLPTSPYYLHFHWQGRPGKPCGLIVGQTYQGYLLQRTAVSEFLWLGGNSANGHGGHVVTPGMDLHSNIVTEWNGDPGHGDGHEDGGCGGHDGGDEGPPDGTGGSGGHDDGSEGGCSGHEDGDDSGCSGHDGGDEGPPDGTGGSGGHDNSSDGSCSGHDNGTDGGCSGHEGSLIVRPMVLPDAEASVKNIVYASSR